MQCCHQHDYIYRYTILTFLKRSLSNPNTTTFQIPLQKLYENYWLFTFNLIIFLCVWCIIRQPVRSKQYDTENLKDIGINIKELNILPRKSVC
jgi:hypothetical protein